MTQLNLVIGSILRDIISAQHEANLYSLALCENYGRDGKAKDFQLPNVIISDMELELKYGVTSVSESTQEFNIKYHQLRGFIKELGRESIKAIISSVISTVLTSDIQRGEEDKRFFIRLQSEAAILKDFTSFLNHNMRDAFFHNLYEVVDSSSGLVKKEVVVTKILDVACENFLYDTELDKLFDGDDGKALRELAESNIKIIIEGLVEKHSKDSNFKKHKTFPQLNVAVTADELANMPEEAIHSFKLTFSPRNYSITQIDDDDILDDFVMQ